MATPGTLPSDMLDLPTNKVKSEGKTKQERGYTSTRTRCLAQFFPYKNRGTLDSDDVDSAMETEDTLVEGDAIVACTISRSKDSPSAVFQLTLKPIKNYKNLIKPGDWVLIYLDTMDNIDFAERKGLKCIGNVDRVADNKVTLGDGSVIKTYTIHGRDFGKVFELTEMYYSPYITEEEKKIIPLTVGFSIQGSPLTFVNEYIDIFLGDGKKNQQLKNALYTMLIPPKLYQIFPSTDRSKSSPVCFKDILNTNYFDKNTDDGYSIFRDISKLTGSNLWSTLTQAANQVVNEMFTDIRDGSPAIIFRKIPLKKESLLALAKQDIMDVPDKFIINRNLGLSDVEHYNFLNIFSPDQVFQDKTYFAAAAGQLPKIAKDATKRYGLRIVERASEFAFSTDGTLGTTKVLQWADELKEYWFNYYHLENGTIELGGYHDPQTRASEFRIGSFIRLPEEKKIYQVEGINYSWSFGETLYTSLTVTHGIYEDGTYIDSDTTNTKSEGTGYYGREEAKPETATAIDINKMLLK